MRKLAVKILQILDGTPAVYGKRQKGQSVVELALVTPILIFMFAGLVEIGWFANNYLNLLDVTRAGARTATTLTDQYAPRNWNTRNSLVPNAWLPQSEFNTQNETDPLARNGDDASRGIVRQIDPNTGLCVETGIPESFFPAVVCLMLRSMPPLQLRDNGVDDIIVSAFSMARVDPRLNRPTLPAGGDVPWLSASRPIPGDVPQVVVVGRYPVNANECDAVIGAAPVIPREPRDPFDFNGNNRIDVRDRDNDGAVDPEDDVDATANEVLNEYGELHNESFPYFDLPASTRLNAEKQVGFSWYGNHVIPGTYCIGSEWRMADMERIFNLPNFTLADNAQRNMLPSQGVALVEMYWQHRQLLNFPFFTFLLDAAGNQPVIYVWAAFPLPDVEPFIQFPAPP